MSQESSAYKPIRRERVGLVHSIVLGFQILAISYAAMYSPFIALHFSSFITYNSAVIFAASFYVISWWRVKRWFKAQWGAAKRRVKEKQLIRKEFEKRYKEGGFVE